VDPGDRMERSGGDGSAGRAHALDRPASEHLPAQDDAVGRAAADDGRAGARERTNDGRGGRTMTLTPPESGWLTPILPELILSVAGMLLILFDVFVPRTRAVIPALAVIDLLVAFWSEMAVENGTFFSGTYQISNITRVFDIVFLLAAILAALLV